MFYVCDDEPALVGTFFYTLLHLLQAIVGSISLP